ncbi:MAG: hypothetical protein ACFB9M_18690 [Myxococcota bacterium]
MKHAALFTAFIALMAAFGPACTAGSSPPEGEGSAEEKSSPPSHPATSTVSDAVYRTLPVPADFAEKAVTDIDERNYKDVLRELEADLQTE